MVECGLDDGLEQVAKAKSDGTESLRKSCRHLTLNGKHHTSNKVQSHYTKLGISMHKTLVLLPSSGSSLRCESLRFSGPSPTRAQAHPRGYEGYDPTLESGPENQVYDVSSVTLMTVDSKAFLDYVVFVRCFAILWLSRASGKFRKRISRAPWGLIQEAHFLCDVAKVPNARQLKIDITQAPLNSTSSEPPYGDPL